MAEPPPAPARPAPPLVAARWFDGRSSQPRAVLVGLADATGQRRPDLLLHPVAEGAPSPAQRIPHRSIHWPEAWHGRRVQRTLAVDLGDHGSLEVDDAAGWHAAVAAAGAPVTWAQRLQTRWQALAMVLLVAGLALWAFYRFGTPWAATQLARHVPLAWETALSEQALQALDAQVLKPSSLPPERQARLREGFAALVQQIPPGLHPYPGYAPALRLDFRAGMGANAFALPGGTIVVTDGLVRLADAKGLDKGLDDSALLGVLAHEAGHVLYRHTTRMVVEQGVLNVGLGLALGDVSSVISTGSALLTGLAYRRSHEMQADCFAIALLGQLQRPTAPMGRLLQALADAPRPSDAPVPASDPKARDGRGRPLAEWLSSHPDTAVRARQMIEGQGGC